MRFIGPEDGCPEENLQHNQATQIFGTYRVSSVTISENRARHLRTSVPLRPDGPISRGDWAVTVCFWHKADAQTALMNVRFERNTGHDADAPLCPLMTQSGHGKHPAQQSTLRCRKAWLKHWFGQRPV